jgi:preprotein translocase subunit SecE
VARNRKRAKERRARRPSPVGSARTERDEGAPSPLRHATPDAELAEAQLALGRPELSSEIEDDVDDEALEAAGAASMRANGGGDASEPPSDGGAVAVPGGAAPSERVRTTSRLINFLQGSWRELQRVQWPDRRQVMQATGVVIGFVIIAGVYLGVADTVAAKLMNWILGT